MYAADDAAKAPQNYEDLWSDYDVNAEPLEVEVIRQWEESAPNDSSKKIISTASGIPAR